MVLALSCSMFLAACSSNESTAIVEEQVQQNIPAPDPDPSFSITKKLDEDNRLEVSASTKFPEGTKIVITVSDMEGTQLRQLKQVTNQSVTSDWFHNNDSGLEGGVYEVTFATMGSDRQDPEVKKYFTENKEILNSTELIVDSMDGDTYSHTEEIEIPNKDGTVATKSSQESKKKTNKSNSYSSKNNYYTKEELESDPFAPSSNPNDYNSNGEYVPYGGVSDNPADYNSSGEYKPADQMTQQEIEAELESMLNGF